jgi:hypothetical protein
MYNDESFKIIKPKHNMKKSILVVDHLLLIIFIFIILSKFIDFPFIKILQPIFFSLVIIHIIQHWKIIIISFKKLFIK